VPNVDDHAVSEVRYTTQGSILAVTDDLNALIDKFRRIGATRAQGDMRGARKLFRAIDWRDEEWCPRFVSDVISALKQVRVR
jgi:hypothetical protein